MKALERGEWQPFHLLCHGDMWHGNVMIGKKGFGGQFFGPFVIIDWPGADLKGFPFYDFTRLALSFRFRGNKLKKAKLDYCKAISCAPDHAIYHYLAAMADLGTHLEHWPVEKYLEKVHLCYNLLADIR